MNGVIKKKSSTPSPPRPELEEAMRNVMRNSLSTELLHVFVNKTSHADAYLEGLGAISNICCLA
jgi:hypothetical protein